MVGLKALGISQDAIFGEEYNPTFFAGRMDAATDVAGRDNMFGCAIRAMLEESQHAGRPTWAYFMGSTWPGGVFNASTGAVDLPAGCLLTLTLPNPVLECLVSGYLQLPYLKLPNPTELEA